MDTRIEELQARALGQDKEVQVNIKKSKQVKDLAARVGQMRYGSNTKQGMSKRDEISAP